MNKKRDYFRQALDYYIQFGNQNCASDLYRACGEVWNDNSEMPINARNDVNDAIENSVEFNQWEKTGRTYAGAARRIRPVLKAKFKLS